MPNRSEQFDENYSKTQEKIQQAKSLDLKKKELDKLAEYEKDLTREATKSKHQLLKEIENEVHKKRVDDYKQEGKVLKAVWEENFGTLDATFGSLKKLTGSLTDSIDKSLTKYLDAQQSLSAHLAGSNTSLTNVLNRLQSTLSTTNIVKQEKVFEKLGSLVSSGITYNVEQRAFLQTLASDIDMVFNAQDGSLTQLIRLQNQDLSSNRMAIEYSLQKFLNQNYQTSEYIKQAFNDVASSLKTAQSTMSAAGAVNFEGTVQTWLGSMYSAGMDKSTITNLASAINQLGSGDLSNIGSGISNLVLLGAARAGLDYGSILHEGLTENTTDKLLAGITSYMQEMGAYDSNVVRSQMGNIFGVSITDLIAANNMRSTEGSVSSDIGTLLGEYNNFVTYGAGLRNTISNLMWSFGTNIASNDAQLAAYEITKLISNSGIGDMLYDVGGVLNNKSSGFLSGSAGKVMQLLGIAVSNAQLLPILSSILSPNGSLSDIISSASYSGAEALFNALGSGALNTGQVKFSGVGTSGSMYVSSSGVNDLLSGSLTSLNDFTSQVTTVEAEDEGPTLEENVTTITDTVVNILDLLTKRLESIDDAVNILALSDNVISAGMTIINKGVSF